MLQRDFRDRNEDDEPYLVCPNFRYQELPFPGFGDTKNSAVTFATEAEAAR